jgi:putative DNA primase/helicase
VLRGAIEVAPMFFIRANEAGSGKTYLVNLFACIATGQLAAAIACTEDDREMENRLTAAAISAMPILHLNNLTFDLNSRLLCQMLTDKVCALRLFFNNGNLIYVDCRRITVYGNGNNVFVVGDLVRRTLTSVLDAETDKPETRTFKLDPMKSALKSRRRYIAAIFNIVRAHIAAGRPKPKDAVHIADFVDSKWSQFVQHPLVWLGKEDPLRCMEDARGDDPERESLSARIQSLKDVFGVGNEFYASDVDKMMKETVPSVVDQSRLPRWPDLVMAFSRGRDKFNSLTISHVRRDDERHTNAYSIVAVKGNESCPKKRNEEPF